MCYQAATKPESLDCPIMQREALTKASTTWQRPQHLQEDMHACVVKPGAKTVIIGQHVQFHRA